MISKALEATDAIIGDDARESCRILRRDITTYEEAAVQFDDVNPVARTAHRGRAGVVVSLSSQGAASAP